MFDEQPDGDIHGECAAEIHRLQAALSDAVEAKDFMHRACLEAQDIAAAANERMLAEYERAEAEGSRAVMLVRQRRRLQDDAKDALAHLTAAEAMTAHNTAISLSLCTAIRNAEVLVRGITQRLPNSPEADAGNGASEAPQSNEKAVPSVAMCSWYQDGDDSDTWATGCDNLFTLIDGTPTENDFRFCCYCGKPVDELPIERDEEDDGQAQDNTKEPTP